MTHSIRRTAGKIISAGPPKRNPFKYPMYECARCGDMRQVPLKEQLGPWFESDADGTNSKPS
jgi:hypothetical protein